MNDVAEDSKMNGLSSPRRTTGRGGKRTLNRLSGQRAVCAYGLYPLAQHSFVDEVDAS